VSEINEHAEVDKMEQIARSAPNSLLTFTNFEAPLIFINSFQCLMPVLESLAELPQLKINIK
jgi:hypothetical protein